METRKLYYEDAFLRSFDATVLSCEESKGGFAVVLDATAFYPEGGGQACDLGTLGNAKVLGNLGLGQIGVFSQIADTPEMHDRLLLFCCGYRYIMPKISCIFMNKYQKILKVYCIISKIKLPKNMDIFRQ